MEHHGTSWRNRNPLKFQRKNPEALKLQGLGHGASGGNRKALKTLRFQCLTDAIQHERSAYPPILATYYNTKAPRLGEPLCVLNIDLESIMNG